MVMVVLKCWPTELVKHMKTHENADPNDIPMTDFCWNLEYLQINKTFSTVHNNATPNKHGVQDSRRSKNVFVEGLSYR